MQIDGLLTERDNLIDTKRDITDSYSKTETDTFLSSKLDSSVINNYSTTSQMNTAIANDFKNKIRFDQNEKCKIECTGDN